MGTKSLDGGWLVEIFAEAGLSPDEAQAAGEAARRKLLLRRSTPNAAKRLPKRGDVRSWMVRDPVVSFNRIVGLSDAELPFMDEEAGTLSLFALTDAMTAVGLDADVALAFAKVVVVAVEPGQFYQPVWEALGKFGPVDLDALRRLDWSPLREGLSLHDVEITMPEVKVRGVTPVPSAPGTAPQVAAPSARRPQAKKPDGKR